MNDTQDRRLAEQIRKHWQGVVYIVNRNTNHLGRFPYGDWAKLKEEIAELERKLKQAGIDL